MGEEKEIICPNCGEKENFHFNYDYGKPNLPIEDVLCNECGTFFEYNEKNMKANELRIGNLVDLGNRVAKVIDIGHLSCTVVDLEETQDTLEDYDRTKGIILNDDWFQRFERFYKDGDYWSIGINDYKYCFAYRDWAKNWAFYQEFTDSPFPEDEGKKHPVSFDIKYVHQLQNLYFALQHEELKLKR